MKIKTLLLPMIAFTLLSCKEKKEPVRDEVAKPVTVDTVVAEPPQEMKTDTAKIEESGNVKTEEAETETDAVSSTFDFRKFSSKNYNFVKKAKLDFSGDEGAYNFRTRINEAYASGDPDFASYYITVVFGCGASCIMGLMMDVRDGKIYWLPLGEENSCLFAEERAIYNVKSRLFISGICKESPEDEKVYYNAFVWNEEKKVFEKADEKDIK